MARGFQLTRRAERDEQLERAGEDETKALKAAGAQSYLGFHLQRVNGLLASDQHRKRLMRAAYRLQKLPLEQALQTKEQQLALFLIYTGKELPEYVLVKEKVEVVLKKLLQTVNGVK